LVLEQIVRQCTDRGLAKGKRQIIDSTHVIANISSSSIIGLVRKCRENMLKTIKKQDAGLAEKLGLKELQDAGSVKYACPEDGLQKEVEASGQLLDKVTVELHEKSWFQTRSCGKIWNYWKRWWLTARNMPKTN
jgi:hypothetical protein